MRTKNQCCCPRKASINTLGEGSVYRTLPCSVIVTVYDEEKSIGRLLQGMTDQTARPREFIVVDGGSTDDTVSHVRTFADENGEWVTLVVDAACNSKHSSSPIAQGRNVGIERAAEEVIAVTDAGCVPDQSWLETIVRPLLDGDADAVGGFYEIRPRTRWEEYFSIVHSLNGVDSDSFIPSSRSFAFRKSFWEKVGGYPLGCKFGEDTEFVLRMREAGARMAIAPHASVTWTPADTDRWIGSIRLWFKYSEGNGQRALLPLNYIKKLAYYGVGLMLLAGGILGLTLSIAPLLWVSLLLGSAWFLGFATRVKGILSRAGRTLKGLCCLGFGIYLASLDFAGLAGYAIGLLKRYSSSDGRHAGERGERHV